MEVVIDRIIIKAEAKQRISDSIETALKLADGVVIINVIDGEDLTYNTNFACTKHGVGISEMEPECFLSMHHMAHVKTVRA